MLDPPKWRIARAAAVIRAGGLIACPTEGVWGFACAPDADIAISRLLALKRRDRGQGFIVVAADLGQLRPWLDVPQEKLRELHEPACVTWVVPATAAVPAVVRGAEDTVAIRITGHALLHTLCAAAGPVISTSANISGAPPIRNRHMAYCIFGRKLDMVVAGESGALAGPTEMRDLLSGEILRPAPSLANPA